MSETSESELPGGDNPLLELDADEQHQIIEAYRAFEQSDHADRDVDRRGVLTAIATLVTGSAIGGGAYMLSTSEVEAAMAAAGQVGTQSDRVDVFAETVDTDQASIAEVVGKASLSANQTIANSTTTQVNLDTVDIEDSAVVDVDTTNNKLVLKQDGVYALKAAIRWDGSADWTAGDLIELRINAGGNDAAFAQEQHVGANSVQGMFVATDVDITADSDVIMRCRQISGAQQSLLASVDHIFLSAVRIG